MKEEIIKSAKSSFFINGVWDFGDAQLEAFYRAAYNKGVSDAAEKVEPGVPTGWKMWVAALYAAPTPPTNTDDSELREAARAVCSEFLENTCIASKSISRLRKALK